jgi:hypothetical protein
MRQGKKLGSTQAVDVVYFYLKNRSSSLNFLEY